MSLLMDFRRHPQGKWAVGLQKGKSMIKKTFKIPDMTCSNCAMKLESLEDTLDGVKEINASYHKLQMVIEYDESKLTDEQIIAAVKKKGYQALAA
jgi:copper chaperone CopZ